MFYAVPREAGRPRLLNAEEKGKCEDMANAGKAWPENLHPPKRVTERKFKGPKAPMRPLRASWLVLSTAQTSRESIWACPLVMLQRGWGRGSLGCR